MYVIPVTSRREDTWHMGLGNFISSIHIAATCVTITTKIKAETSLTTYYSLGSHSTWESSQSAESRDLG